MLHDLIAGGATVGVILVLYLTKNMVMGFFDKGEKAADDAIEVAPFFQKHPGYKSALEYTIHLLNIAAKATYQQIVDKAKAEGSFDDAVKQTAKAAAIGNFKALASKETVEQLLTELGVPADATHKLDGLLDILLHAVIHDTAQKKSVVEAIASPALVAKAEKAMANAPGGVVGEIAALARVANEAKPAGAPDAPLAVAPSLT